MERHNRNILVALIAVVIAAAVFSSFGLSLFAGPTPQIVLPTPVPTGEEPGKDAQEDGIRVEVSPDTVQSVIAALDRQESYSRVVTSTLEGATAATSAAASASSWASRRSASSSWDEAASAFCLSSAAAAADASAALATDA